MKKIQKAEQFRRALQMFAQSLNDEDAMEIATVYPPHEIDKVYKVGEMFTFGENGVGDPQLYRVVQHHTSQVDWIPSETPALYTPIGLNDNGYPVWSRPTGAHDSYNIGDVVEYEGVLYESLMNGNVYSPVEYVNGWKVFEGVMNE